jgi:hypothetical protein
MPAWFPRATPALLSFLVLIAVTLGVDAAATETSEADNRTAADLLPATVVVYAEVPRLGDVISVVTEHPLRERIEAMPEFEAVRDSPQLAQLRKGVVAFEASMGQPWQQAIASLSEEGIHLAIDGQTQGAALLIKSSRRDQLERFRNFLLGIAQLGQGKVGMVQQGVYRGFTAYAINEQLKMAVVDDWFLVTNKPQLGQAIIDRYLDRDQRSLRSSDHFAAAFNEPIEATDQASAKAYVNLQPIRNAGIAPGLYGGKTDNVIAEMLLGGIVGNLQHTPYAVARMNVGRSGILLTLATPHEAQWTAGREYFFGDDSDASAPPLLDIPDRLLAISSSRDLSQMWLRAPDLMTDKANEELTKADSVLTTFFSGRDFGEDILGSLYPEIQVVAGKQSFADQTPIPAIKLPAFAIQFRMRTPDVTTREFRRVFWSFVGFLNVVGAMNGQPQLDLDFEELDAATLVTASYVAPLDDQDDALTPIHFNFSPTLAFAGERVVLASTRDLARTLVRATDGADSTSSRPNTRAVLTAGELASSLADNKAQLVAQNMLEKGHSPQQANAEIGLLLKIVQWFEGASIDLDVTDSELVLSAGLKVRSE